MSAGDHEAVARAVFAANRYMVLGTADADGLPWTTPVWYAREGHGELHWVSDPHARHSRNIAARPQISVVIFDSQVAVGSAAAVYMWAVAAELEGAELERGLDVFGRESGAQRLRIWTMSDVTAPARHRLYRAVVSEQWVLGPRDERLPVTVA